MDRMELKKYFKEIVELSSQIDLKYGIMLSPIVLPYKEFEKHKSDLPYYSNIESEGIVIKS